MNFTGDFVTNEEFQNRLLRAIYPTPEEMDFGAQYFHGDLADIPRPELHGEFKRIELRLLLDPQPTPWLLERYDLIERQLNE